MFLSLPLSLSPLPCSTTRWLDISSDSLITSSEGCSDDDITSNERHFESMCRTKAESRAESGGQEAIASDGKNPHLKNKYIYTCNYSCNFIIIKKKCIYMYMYIAYMYMYSNGQ